MRLMFAVLLVVLAVGAAGCAGSGSGHVPGAHRSAAAPVVATVQPAASTSPSSCAALVSAWDAISLPYTPAPASPENSVAQTMFKIRQATDADNSALLETLGKKLARQTLAVLHYDLPPRCAPSLRNNVRMQMVFAGVTGVAIELGRFNTAASSMRQAVKYQKRVMAAEDRITGSDNGGW